jgi:hypothetical protein
MKGREPQLSITVISHGSVIQLIVAKSQTQNLFSCLKKQYQAVCLDYIKLLLSSRKVLLRLGHIKKNILFRGDRYACVSVYENVMTLLTHTNFISG